MLYELYFDKHLATDNAEIIPNNQQSASWNRFSFSAALVLDSKDKLNDIHPAYVE